MLYLSFQKFDFDETKSIVQQQKRTLQLYNFWVVAMLRFLYKLQTKLYIFSWHNLY